MNLMRRTVFDFKDDLTGEITDVTKVYIKVASKVEPKHWLPKVTHEEQFR